MLNYIAEAHRLDLLRQAEEARLVRLARNEYPAQFVGSPSALRQRVTVWMQSRTHQSPKPLTTQEMQPCVDAG